MTQPPVKDRQDRPFAMGYNDIIRRIGDGMAVSVYMLLKTHANYGNGTDAYPSRARLAAYLGHSTPRAVDRAIDILKQLGLLDSYTRWETTTGEKRQILEEQIPGVPTRKTSNGYIVYSQFGQGRHADPQFIEATIAKHERLIKQGAKGKTAGQGIEVEEAPELDKVAGHPQVHNRTYTPSVQTDTSPPESPPKSDPQVADRTYGAYVQMATVTRTQDYLEPETGGEVAAKLTTARGETSSPQDFPSEWIDMPSAARCADHAGLADPPNCGKCADLRRKAQAQRDIRQQRNRALEIAEAKARQDAAKKSTAEMLGEWDQNKARVAQQRKQGRGLQSALAARDMNSLDDALRKPEEPTTDATESDETPPTPPDPQTNN